MGKSTPVARLLDWLRLLKAICGCALLLGLAMIPVVLVIRGLVWLLFWTP